MSRTDLTDIGRVGVAGLIGAVIIFATAVAAPKFPSGDGAWRLVLASSIGVWAAAALITRLHNPHLLLLGTALNAVAFLVQPATSMAAESHAANPAQLMDVWYGTDGMVMSFGTAFGLLVYVAASLLRLRVPRESS